MGKRELIALLNLSSWCLVMVEQLFLAVPRGCLRFVIVVFPDHTHLLFFLVDVSIKVTNLLNCSQIYTCTCLCGRELNFFYSFFFKFLTLLIFHTFILFKDISCNLY